VLKAEKQSRWSD